MRSAALFRSTLPSVPVAGLLLGACLATPDRLDPAAELARALDPAQALVFRREGPPLDQPSSAGVLALATAVQHALLASPEIAAALARVRRAEADADLARAWPNPVLDVVLRFPSGGGGTEIDAGIAADLFALLTRPRRATAAEERLAASVASAVGVALDVVAETRRLHATAQAEDELAALARERRALVERLLDVARARLEAGEGTRIDVTALEAQSIELDLEIEEHEALRKRGRLALARRIGNPSGDTDWDLAPREQPPAVEGREAQWIARALEARTELHALRRELAALSTEAGLAAHEVLAGTTAGLEFERAEGEALGPALTLPLPLFSGGGARRRRAVAELEVARAELVSAQRTVVEEVRTALGDLDAARDRLERIDQRLLPLERARRAQVEEVFLAGQVDVTALLFAEQGLQSALTRRVELATELLQAWARLERAVGGAGALRTQHDDNGERVQP